MEFASRLRDRFDKLFDLFFERKGRKSVENDRIYFETTEQTIRIRTLEQRRNKDTSKITV